MNPGVKPLAIRTTNIPGLLFVDLPVHGDARGWFKENWNRAKQMELGLPDFGPVQNNVSFNSEVGVTRGFHAEPWDKYISVTSGKVFGAWVDLREGETFGRSVSLEIDPSVAVFVPRGVANAFQTLESGTAYSYLVNDHWSADASYTFVNLADPTVAMDWPIPLEDCVLSEKDQNHPLLPDVLPVLPMRTLVLGADGQLGRALQSLWAGRADVDFLGRSSLDLTDAAALDRIPWQSYAVVVNAAAYTAVDQAETPEGREVAWAVNATAPSRLAAIASRHRIKLVHVSSDYVYDGAREQHLESEPLSPLGAYGQSKAAGDLAVATTPAHYIVRTSWVVGDGKNFVHTMAGLAARGVQPKVVDDQFGRLTFTEDLAAAIQHLLDTKAPYGTYHVSNTGAPASWKAIAAEVFRLTGHDESVVAGVSTEDYFAGSPMAAPRPRHSDLSLEKIQSTGFHPRDQWQALEAYMGTIS